MIIGSPLPPVRNPLCWTTILTRAADRRGAVMCANILPTEFAKTQAVVCWEDPGVGQVHDFGQQLQVIAAERFGLLPFLAVFVDAADRDVVTGSRCRLVLPDRGLDRPETNFMDRLLFRLRHRCVPRRVRKHHHTLTRTRLS